MPQSTFILFLRILGFMFLVVGLLHVFLGLNADLLLGAKISSETLASPGLDSQNRFYGAAFMLYGVVLILSSQDLERYQMMVIAVFLCFWLAGWVRLISVWLHGLPPVLMVLLGAVELLLPPLMLVWFQSVRSTFPKAG